MNLSSLKQPLKKISLALYAVLVGFLADWFLSAADRVVVSARV